jgi:hypothetical protein
MFAALYVVRLWKFAEASEYLFFYRADYVGVVTSFSTADANRPSRWCSVYAGISLFLQLSGGSYINENSGMFGCEGYEAFVLIILDVS